MLTHAQLIDALSYDSETGIFRWKKKGKNVRIGEIAGSMKSNGYLRIKLNQREYLSHRLAWFYMTGAWPTDFIDHKDRNPLNNSFANLRECSNALNQQNSGLSKTNSTGIKGVDIKDGKYRARISVKGVRIDFGLFDDIDLAELVASEARKKYHGEFARNR